MNNQTIIKLDHNVLLGFSEDFFISKISGSLVFLKIDVLKNFENFTGKHLCWSLFLVKLQAFRPLKEKST